ncbi:MAG: CooT family nickel-binding protein [Magnetospirillum sp.]|nr:CooT family nickel-binding protein [Magnetospirillum sp.]
MCQLTVKITRHGHEEVLARDVASVESRDDAVVLLPLFDEPITVAHAAIQRIDSMNAVVTLAETAP